jgi:hypothetical protein
MVAMISSQLPSEEPSSLKSGSNPISITRHLRLNNKRQNSIKNSALGWVQMGIFFEHSDMP